MSREPWRPKTFFKIWKNWVQWWIPCLILPLETKSFVEKFHWEHLLKDKRFLSQLHKVQMFHKAHSLTSKHRISGSPWHSHGRVGCESALICPYMPLATGLIKLSLNTHLSWWELVHDCHRVFKLWDLWARNLVLLLSSNTQGVRASHGAEVSWAFLHDPYVPWVNHSHVVCSWPYGVPKEAYWFTDFKKHNFNTIYRTRRALLEFFAKKRRFFCFFQNRLVGYQKKRIDSLNKDSTML